MSESSHKLTKNFDGEAERVPRLLEEHRATERRMLSGMSSNQITSGEVTAWFICTHFRSVRPRISMI